MTTQTFTVAPRPGPGRQPLEIAVVGGSVDGFSPTLRHAGAHIVTTSAGQTLIAFALLGQGRFQPLSVIGSARAAATVAGPVADRTVEIYAFTGYREVVRRVLPDRHVPVFAHVDTRPLQLTQHQGAAVISVG